MKKLILFCLLFCIGVVIADDRYTEIYYSQPKKNVLTVETAKENIERILAEQPISIPPSDIECNDKCIKLQYSKRNFMTGGSVPVGQSIYWDTPDEIAILRHNASGKHMVDIKKNSKLIYRVTTHDEENALKFVDSFYFMRDAKKKKTADKVKSSSPSQSPDA